METALAAVCFRRPGPGHPCLVPGNSHPSYTVICPFMDITSTKFVGLDNYIFALTDRIMLEAFRVNLLWMVVGTPVYVSVWDC